jgi:hypothetical protein
MKQIARNVTMEGCGILRDCRYLLHDRDTKYTQSFRAINASGRVEPLALPACSPNLNAYAERWVRSVKEECLSKVILFGERSLRRALSEYVEHYHAERNHQGKDNVLLFSRDTDILPEGPVQCRERLGRQSPLQLGLQDADFGGQIFVPRQQLLVHHPRDVGQDARPIHNGPLAPTVRDGGVDRPR